MRCMSPAGSSSSYMAISLVGATYRGYVYQGNPATFPYGGLYDPQFDALTKNLATALPYIVKTIAAEPLSMLKWYFVDKQVLLFQWTNIDGVGDIFVYPVTASPFRDNWMFIADRSLFFHTHEVVLVLAGLGCLLAWTRAALLLRGETGQLVLRMASALVIFHYIIHVPFAGVGRYTVPLYPVIYLLAVAAIVLLYRLMREHVALSKRP
jgi:hypothetical protein